MSSKRDITKPHKCLFKKCKGHLVDDPDTYGTWAYWWGVVESPVDSGWHNSPRVEDEKV